MGMGSRRSRQPTLFEREPVHPRRRHARTFAGTGQMFQILYSVIRSAIRNVERTSSPEGRIHVVPVASAQRCRSPF